VHELVFNTCDSNMHGERIKKNGNEPSGSIKCWEVLD
jgi:hypothetical protein